MILIADTDVLIDYLSGEGRTAERVALEIDAGELHTTAVTRFELLSGAKTARQERLILDLLEAVPTLPLDADAADRAAEVRRALEKQGMPIGMGDSLVAGIVLTHKGILLTRNLTHFERVEGLRISGRYDA